MRDLRKTIILAVVLAFSATIAAAEAHGSFTKNLTVSGEISIDVSTGSGNVHIRTGSSNNVEVVGKIHANNGGWFGSDNRLSAEERVRRLEANPPVRQNGSNIVVGQIEEPELRRNVSIDYEITVPQSTRVHSETGSGDQEIDGVRGPVRASTGSGNIRANDIGDDLRVSTGSGDVRLERVKGRVYARTGSGEIEARNAGGLEAETGSGNIKYDQATPGDVSAHTGSGTIELSHVHGGLDAHSGSGDIRVDGEAKSNWTIRASSGTVELRLADSAGFELDAHSGSGDVTIDRPITVTGTMRHNRVQGKVGNGGALLSLETGSGDIRVR